MMKKATKQNKHIRKGDKVLVIAGNERGQVGTVLSRSDDRAVVQGLNLRKRHVKKSQTNPNGSIIDIEAPIHLSNLCLCQEGDKRIKPRVRVQKGEKELYYVDGGREVALRPVRKTK